MQIKKVLGILSLVLVLQLNAGLFDMIYGENISKEELEKALLSHPYILQLYNIDPVDLNKLIGDLETKK